MEVNEDYSCPFLYTWDGYEYSVENDIYSTGRGEDREFVDYLGIQNTVIPKGGVYSFEIRERSTEQSWTDTLKLVVIDHSSNVEVGTDSEGNFHSFSRVFTPDLATDGDRNNVLPAVSAIDDVPVNIEHAETILLDFSSVDISDGAKLVIRVNGFEGELTGENIREVPAVLIQTFSQGEWITRHRFFPKELWAIGVFDLKPFFEESHQVRLVGVSCHEGKYHQVDYIGLDNTVDTLDYQIIDPVSAILGTEKDVLSRVLNSDDIYAFTDCNEIITVSFPCPPLKLDSRNFVLISEGYYKTTGNTFFVYTWDGSDWIQRFDFEPVNYEMDTQATYELGQYLPDIDGDFKVKIEHRVHAGVYQSAEGKLDYIYLVVDGIEYYPISAIEMTTGLDLIHQVTDDDEIYWLATNQAAIIDFEVVSVR